MNLTPRDIYNYIMEEDMEAEFLAALQLNKYNFSIAEIVDAKFDVEDGKVFLRAPSYQLDLEITDDEIAGAVKNALYVSTFISRKEDVYNVHFLVHQVPVLMKPQSEDEILEAVIRYMVMNTIVALRLDHPDKVKQYIGRTKK